MRIAIAGLQHESNTFASAGTSREQFQQDCLLFDDDIAPRWRDAHHEIAGFFAAGDELHYETVPLVMAKATPSGPVDSALVEEIVGEIICRLNRCRVDGLLLALHGAMVTDQEHSGDTFVLQALRQALGPALPIVVTLDFHANCTEQMAQLANAALFYQTNPHTDMRSKGIEAGRLLYRIVGGEVRPTMSLCRPPMIVPINHQQTAAEPLRELLAAARHAERRQDVLSVSLSPGFPYADVPAMGPTVLAVTDANPALADDIASELAQRLWQARKAMAIELPTAAQAVRDALQCATSPVVLVDFGDNVGGGSAADGTLILAELVKQRARRSVVTIADPQAVAQCTAAGIGASLTLTVGGKTDRLHGEPVRLKGEVRFLHDGRWVESQARHGGVRFNDQGPTVLFEWGQDNSLCLTTKRYPPFSLGQITSLGINPRHQQILVVKAAIAYRAAYEPIAGRIIEVDTPGLTAVSPAHFNYQHIRRPIWPLDPETTY